MSTNEPQVHVRRLHIHAWLIVALGLLVALVSALLVGGARSATPASGLIAFTRSDGIYVMNADGSSVRALRRGGAAKFSTNLAWSPDGRKLAFEFHSATSVGIWVMNADGSQLVRLAKNGTSPTWSPDGSRIAFIRFIGRWVGKRLVGDSDIWVMNADGSNHRRLVKTAHLSEFEVDWSPAGGRLAFRCSVWAAELYVMGTNGRNLRSLTRGWGVSAGQPQWSPDGRRIAFKASKPGLPGGISVVNADGTGRTQLTAKHGVYDVSPTWSPDGRQIAFVRTPPQTEFQVEGNASSEIYVMYVDGTELTQLTNNRVKEGSPAWRPVAPTVVDPAVS